MSLLDVFAPPPVQPRGGQVVRLLDLSIPGPAPKKERRIAPRSRMMQVPAATVRLVRALRLIGLSRAQIARMTNCSAESVSEYSRKLRRRSAGQPSDKEIMEAGLFAAGCAVTQRKKKT
jgi:hypothetical protein